MRSPFSAPPSLQKQFMRLLALTGILCVAVVFLLLLPHPHPDPAGADDAEVTPPPHSATVPNPDPDPDPDISILPTRETSPPLSSVRKRTAEATAVLRRRHADALADLGLPPMHGPAPRRALAKETLELPPGNDLRLIVKFTDDMLARMDADGTLEVSGDTEDLAGVIDRHDITFGLNHTAPEPDLVRLEARALSATAILPADLPGMLAARTSDPSRESVLAAAQALQALPGVEFVTIESLDQPPPPPFMAAGSVVTEDLTAHQTYRGPQSSNIDAAAAVPGIRGRHVRISHCEYSYDTEHEDLIGQVRLQTGFNNFVPQYAEDTDHGTAALGIMTAADNGFGMTGLVPEADVWFYADYGTVNGLFQGRAATLAAAAADSLPGDVIVAEMQDIRFAPAETDAAVWLVTRTATDAGIHVVAAAGNGNRDLDGADYTAYRARGSSGAIIVGAGGHRGLTGLFSTARGKMGFSSFGSRVDVQGPGENVATLGYGALQRYDNDPRRTYTAGFAGTSSATPVVAGLVAAIQSVALEAQARRLPPREMRNLLVATGLPQRPDPFNPMAADLQSIGPLPDVPAALNRLLGGGASAPVILSVTATPSDPGLFELSVVTDAANPDDLIYQWEGFPGGFMFFDSNTSTAHTTSVRPSKDGPARLFVRVINAAGLSSEAEVGIVADSTPKELMIGPPNPWRTVNLGGSLELWTLWRYSNPQANDVRTASTWQALQGGVITAVSNAFGRTTFRAEGLLPGDYTVEATADGVTVSAAVTVVLGDNQVHIHQHPQSVLVEDAVDSLDLSAAAYGRGTLSFQWYQGLSGDTANPVGEPQTVSPPTAGAEHLASASLSLQAGNLANHWVRVADEDGNTADSLPARRVLATTRGSSETEALQNRHAAALIDLGLTAPANPEPRVVPAKEPLVQPPGQTLRILVKFRDDLLARADTKGNAVLSGGFPEDLTAVVMAHGLRFERSHSVDDASLALLEARALHSTGGQPPDLAALLHALPSRTDRASVLAAAQALQVLDEVEFVSVESLDVLPAAPVTRNTIWSPRSPTAAEVTADRTASQFDYRDIAGLNFNLALANFPAADGRHVQVSVIGYALDSRHEDLAGQVTLQPGHQSFHASAVEDHGTAIVGLLAAADNGFGLTGVAPKASFEFFADRGTVNGRVQGRAAALAAALAGSAPGDVVLLAVQSSDQGPAETDPAVWMLSKTGTDAGVHVVATAGQGNHNLDGDAFATYRDRGDSGAILVGQGTCADLWDLNSGYGLQLARGAVPETPYGSWIHLQGPGQTTLSTLGHGSTLNHGPGRTYDSYFGGGGAAAALVAGAVAAVSSAAVADSAPMTQTALRSLLVETARPQVADLDRRIGPLPDVAMALNHLLRPSEPEVSITTLTPGTPNSSDALSLTLAVSNDSGAVLSYVWTLEQVSETAGFYGRSNVNGTTLWQLLTDVTYTARLTVVNARGMRAERSLVLPRIAPVPTRVQMSGQSTVRSGQVVQLSATVYDQSDRVYAPVVGPVWSVDGGGTIDPQTGLFRAGAIGGTFTVTASAGNITGTRAITVQAPPLAVIAAPRNRVVEAGGQSAELAVTAAGTGSLTFQLYRGVSRDRSVAVGEAVTVAGDTQGTEFVFTTPPVDGVQHYWVEVTDQDGNTAVSRETRVGVTGAGPKSRFADWQLSYGIEGPSAEPDASFSGDGIPNRMKYALGLNPRIPAQTGALARAGGILPQAGDQSAWVLYYQRGMERGDAETRIEFSSDLQIWQTAERDEEDPLHTPDGEREARRVLVPLGQSPDKVFFRLRVLPAPEPRL